MEANVTGFVLASPLIFLWLSVPSVIAKDSEHSSVQWINAVPQTPVPKDVREAVKNQPFIGPQPSMHTTYDPVSKGRQTISSGNGLYLNALITPDSSTHEPSMLAKESASIHWAVQWVLGLGAVILLIYGLAYLLKNHYRPLTMTKHLKAVAWLSVGQRERIAIIQAGNKQYLIGITAGQITTIDSIDPPIQDNSVTAFADHLPSWWKQKT